MFHQGPQNSQGQSLPLPKALTILTVPSMSIARKILSNTAIQVTGKLITAVLSIVIIKYITSLETIPSLSGLPAEYKLIYTYLMFFGILADFGLFTIAVREMSQSQSDEETHNILSNIFGMRLMTIVLAMGMASLFVFLIPFENYTDQVKLGVAIAAITTVFTMLTSTTSSILQVRLKMWVPTISLVIGKIIMATYIIYTVTYFQTIENAFYHLIGAGILGTFVSFCITFSYTKTLIPFSPKFEKEYWKKILKEALPYGLAIILGTIYLKVDILFLSVMRPKEEIALYGYPASMIELLLILPIYFMNSTLPTLSRAFKNNQEQIKKIFSLAFNFLYTMALPMTIGGIILARPLMALITNDAFLTGNTASTYGADFAFQVLLIPCAIAYLTTLLSFTIIASGNQGKLLKINIIAVLFNIIANLILIPTYGFPAAAITTLASELLLFSITLWESKKYADLYFDWSTLIKISLGGAIMGVFVYISQSTIPTIPLIGIAALIYVTSLIPLGVINKEMISYIKK